MALSDLDKIFWLRAGMGGVTGLAADLVFSSDYISGILLAVIVYMGSFYLVRSVWGKSFKPEQLSKLYTTALGTFVLVFLFTWIFTFTVGLSYLHL
jgi:hypothetical protein